MAECKDAAMHIISLEGHSKTSRVEHRKSLKSQTQSARMKSE